MKPERHIPSLAYSFYSYISIVCGGSAGLATALQALAFKGNHSFLPPAFLLPLTTRDSPQSSLIQSQLHYRLILLLQSESIRYELGLLKL